MSTPVKWFRYAVTCDDTAPPRLVAIANTRADARVHISYIGVADKSLYKVVRVKIIPQES